MGYAEAGLNLLRATLGRLQVRLGRGTYRAVVAGAEPRKDVRGRSIIERVHELDERFLRRHIYEA